MTEDEAVVLVNTLLRDASALPQLVKHDGWEYHIHATSPDAPLADRMAVDAAMAFADVIRADELARLRCCAALTARTCSSTCRRTAHAGSAASPAPTGSTWPPTAPAAVLADHGAS